MPGKTDFLRINAFAIKDLIKRKLSEDTRFTDQVYEGSNLAILIDIFSYIAQTLLYQINNAASESMFSDTRMYENMNRLCNFLGYDPKGSAPSSITVALEPDDVEAYLEDTNAESVTMCKYSFVKVGRSDAKGRSICYSLGNTNVTPVKVVGGTGGSGSALKTVMYNGMWKLYPTVFVSTGDPWETFTLDRLKSDSSLNEYVAHGFVDVYAVTYGLDRTGAKVIEECTRFHYTDRQLFRVPVENRTAFETGDQDGDFAMSDSAKLIYQGNTDTAESGQEMDLVFNLRLNEDKQYEIKFGDGVTGVIPPKGSSIMVVYLETNGPYGEIDVGEIDRANIVPNQLGMADALADKVFDIVRDERGKVVTKFYAGRVSNTSPSTIARAEESVDAIRDSAPNWFKMGNRLVTKDDYEYYLMHSAFTAGFFSDVKAMNNWEYVSTFYKWLYDLGTRYFNDPRHYLNQNRLVKNDFQVADPADCNNIYLWVCRGSDTASAEDDIGAVDLFDSIKVALMPIKDMTHEPVILDAVPVYFGICAASRDMARSFIGKDVSTIDFNGVSTRSYFEVEIDDMAFYASSTIARQVEGKIRNFFREAAGHIGGFVNFNTLMTDIMDIDGIVNVRTVYIPMDANNEKNTAAPIICSGLCFASWSGALDTLIDTGIDMEVSNTGRSLEQFQYPKLADASQLSRSIKVIRKSMNSIQRVQY